MENVFLKIAKAVVLKDIPSFSIDSFVIFLHVVSCSEKL